MKLIYENFFDKTEMLEKTFIQATDYGSEESSKRKFERHQTALFDWPNSSPYMISNSSFV